MIERFFFILMLHIFLAGCSSSRFYELALSASDLKQVQGPISLQSFINLEANEIYEYCVSYDVETDIGMILLLRCVNELLAKNDLTDAEQRYAISQYNLALLNLVKLRKDESPSISLNIRGPNNFIIASDMSSLDNRLRPSYFGELGVSVVVKRENMGSERDKYYPLEGIFTSYTATLDEITAVEGVLHANISIIQVDSATKISIGSNTYQLKYSPSAAYLALLEYADIDDYSLLGFINAADAEERRGVFSIGEYSATKIPVIMIHGLNSDPLIWRHLSMSILNNESLHNTFQIWHVYYPSGPPPFFNAMKIRKKLNDFLSKINSPGISEKAFFVGHSMGGIIGKLLTTNSGYHLWDATFNERPEQLLEGSDDELKNVFIFKPPFNHNTVFFLDTPHKGSNVASSLIGLISSSIVTLPNNFRRLFRDFIDRVGLDKLTPAMYPFLQDYGPNSIQVLRPGHPLMESLYTLNVEGEAFSIIGSTTRIACEPMVSCNEIDDGVVTFDSAYLDTAIESIIVESAHNSFQSETAIEFILTNLSVQANQKNKQQ